MCSKCGQNVVILWAVQGVWHVCVFESVGRVTCWLVHVVQVAIDPAQQTSTLGTPTPHPDRCDWRLRGGSTWLFSSQKRGKRIHKANNIILHKPLCTGSPPQVPRTKQLPSGMLRDASTRSRARPPDHMRLWARAGFAAASLMRRPAAEAQHKWSV